MMDRRCTNDSCLIAAGTRSVNLDLPVASVLMNPKQEWMGLTAGRNKIKVARSIEVDWKTFTQDTHLFTHATIVASVATASNGYYIDPACNELVNNNGNAWTNDVLLSTFRTFIGGENYLEHVQIPELSKGKILDAVARPVRYKAKDGKEADVYYVDILVATDRRHSGLVSRIASGSLTTMSMGCLADYVQCSRCGKVLGDNDTNCEHISSQLLQSFVDEDGVERIVAELCGRAIDQDGKLIGDPNSVRFIEASWVDKPAFCGAVLNHYVCDPQTSHIVAFPTQKLEDTIEDLFKMRVADRSGMIALNVARAELMRRRREAMIDRVVSSSF